MFIKFSKFENTFVSLSSREKFQNQMKPQDPHNESQHSYPKPVHSIYSDGCGPPENWEENYGTPSQQTNQRTSNQRFN
jgi:hypothetical protein